MAELTELIEGENTYEITNTYMEDGTKCRSGMVLTEGEAEELLNELKAILDEDE